MPELFKYSYRVFKLDLTPGLTDFEIALDARKVVYASPTDGPELSVKLQAKSNDGIPLRPQGELVAPFQRLYISSAAIARTVFLLIGSPEDIQLTGRDVSISGSIGTASSEESATKLGQLFVGTHDFFSNPTFMTKLQLFNPVGSGKTLLLYDVLLQHWLAASAAGAAGASRRIKRFINGTPLTNLWNPGGNMSAGGAAPAGQLRYFAGDNTFEAGGFADATYPTATPIRFPVFCLIPPGQGYGIQDTGNSLNLNVEWRWKEF